MNLHTYIYYLLTYICMFVSVWKYVCVCMCLLMCMCGYEFSIFHDYLLIKSYPMTIHLHNITPHSPSTIYIQTSLRIHPTQIYLQTVTPHFTQNNLLTNRHSAFRPRKSTYRIVLRIPHTTIYLQNFTPHSPNSRQVEIATLRL